MSDYRKFALAVLAIVAVGATFIVLVGGAAGATLATEPQRHVVDASEIQARIDQQVGQSEADRQAIQAMLQRPAVRRIAESAGLDLRRANAAAAVLSGPALEELAAQARIVDAGLVGGDEKIVLSMTAVIVILLILILLLH